jgi:hypothetical protein
MKHKYFDCECHAIEHVMSFGTFDDESVIYCDLILSDRRFSGRLGRFFKFLLKKPSKYDFHSGISFFTQIGEYNHQKELIDELNKIIESKFKTPDWCECEISKSEGIDFITVIQYQKERKEEQEYKSISINYPGDLLTLTFEVDLPKGKQYWPIETTTYVTLNRNVSFFKRLLRGIRYLFTTHYGISHEFIIPKEAAKEIKETIEIKEDD